METQLNLLKVTEERTPESSWYQMLHSILLTNQQSQTLSRSASFGLKDSTTEESLLTSTRFHMTKAEMFSLYLRHTGPQALHTRLTPALLLRDLLIHSRSDQRTQLDTVSTQRLFQSKRLRFQIDPTQLQQRKWSTVT